MVTTRSQAITQSMTNPFEIGDIVGILRDSNNSSRVGRVGMVVAVKGMKTVSIQLGQDAQFDKRVSTLEKVIYHDGLLYDVDKDYFWWPTDNGIICFDNDDVIDLRYESD
jgi:hypothetical protein